MNPLVLLGIAALAYFALTSKAAQPSESDPNVIDVPPGTMSKAEVQIIKRGNANELYRTGLDGTHKKTFVAAAAARLAGLGDTRATEVAKYALTLPNEEDTP